MTAPKNRKTTKNVRRPVAPELPPSFSGLGPVEVFERVEASLRADRPGEPSPSRTLEIARGLERGEIVISLPALKAARQVLVHHAALLESAGRDLEEWDAGIFASSRAPSNTIQMIDHVLDGFRSSEVRRGS